MNLDSADLGGQTQMTSAKSVWFGGPAYESRRAGYLWLKELPLSVGDRLLLQDKTAWRHGKLQWRWEKALYTVVGQPKPGIPVYEVQLEGTPGPLCVVCQNILRPCVFVAKYYEGERVVPTEPAPAVIMDEEWWVLPPSTEPCTPCSKKAWESPCSPILVNYSHIMETT